MGRRPRTTALRTLTAPTLVLLGADNRTHDPDKVARSAIRLLPHVRTASLPGVSHHAMPHACARQLNAAVVEFLDSAEPLRDAA